jgi:hypothetical protein
MSEVLIAVCVGFVVVLGWGFSLYLRYRVWLLESEHALLRQKVSMLDVENKKLIAFIMNCLLRHVPDEGDER